MSITVPGTDIFENIYECFNMAATYLNKNGNFRSLGVFQKIAGTSVLTLYRFGSFK